MRILPDHPNLDFLRREAKHLLAALREADPTASLSDAQRLVADQYGFRTWPDLKAEVDRRRGEVPQADVHLSTALTQAFGLGELVADPVAVSWAYMGRRWRLRTDRGDFSVGTVFDYIGAEAAEVAGDLRERARAAGVIAPRPVRSPAGRLVERVRDQSWRVDEWMETGPEVLQPARSSVLRNVGRTLATLHEVAPPADRPMTGWLTSRRSDEEWDALVARVEAAGPPWLGDLRRVLPALRELAAVPFVPASEAALVCISDLNVGAVRMGPADELVLVHWDFTGPHHPAWELAYVLVHWAVHPPVNPGAARALVDGYAERRPVPDLDLSSFWIAITAHLSWTFNQVCAALGGAEGEERAFAEQELRDLLADPLTVGRLERVVAEVTARP